MHTIRTTSLSGHKGFCKLSMEETRKVFGMDREEELIAYISEEIKKALRKKT